MSRMASLCVLSLLSMTAAFGAQSPIRTQPVPLEPVAAILDAFKSNPIIALSEPHGNEQAYNVRLKLLRDARFPTLVDDIVIEAGNSRYQDVINRFMQGENVPDATLRRVWQDIVTPGPAGDLEIYAGFYRAVREVNMALPRERRLRVLLADPPIDWDSVKTGDDLVEWGLKRDVFAAELITQEIIARKRRALLVFGEGHLRRRNVRPNYEADDYPGPFVSILARTSPQQRIFTISAAAADIVDITKLIDVTSWPGPSLVMVPGTTLGALDDGVMAGSPARYLMREGKRINIPREQWRSIPFEEQFDAMLYLGPRSGFTQSRIPATLCADTEYVKMRLARMALVGQPADEFKRRCPVSPQ